MDELKQAIDQENAEDFDSWAEKYGRPNDSWLESAKQQYSTTFFGIRLSNTVGSSLI